MKRLAGIVLVSFILASAIAVYTGEEALPTDLDSYKYIGSLVIPDKNSPLFGFFHFHMMDSGYVFSKPLE